MTTTASPTPVVVFSTAHRWAILAVTAREQLAAAPVAHSTRPVDGSRAGCGGSTSRPPTP